MRAVGVKSYSAAVWKFRLPSSRFLPRLAVSHGGGEADRVAQPPPWRFQDSGQTKHFSRLHDHDVGSRHATSQAVADTAHRADHTWNPTLGRPYGAAIRQPGPSVPSALAGPFSVISQGLLPNKTTHGPSRPPASRANTLPHFSLNTGLRVRHILRKLCPRLLVDADLRALRHSSKPR
jgi:hypothetical protein